MFESLKIYLLVSLYIRKFKKNCHLFWVHYIQRKTRREERKKKSLHKEDKITIFAMFVLKKYCTLLKILISHWMKKKKKLKNKIHFYMFYDKNWSLKEPIKVLH